MTSFVEVSHSPAVAKLGQNYRGRCGFIGSSGEAFQVLGHLSGSMDAISCFRYIQTLHVVKME